MTPSELSKVAQRVADLLARESNVDLTAEELATEIAASAVEVYEEIQAKSYNLVVVASFKLPDGAVHTAAVGPLSTRAKQRARDLGARFAWDYKTRRGDGKYSLVPLVRNPNEAWDEARAQQVEKIIEVTRPSLSLDPYGPACTCGLDTTLLQEQGKYFLCPRHSEESDGREDPAGSDGHPA